MRRLLILIALFIGMLCLTTPAYAYLDPGTGSILLQGLLAGVASAIAVLKLYWRRIKQFVITCKQKIFPVQQKKEQPDLEHGKKPDDKSTTQ